MKTSSNILSTAILAAAGLLTASCNHKDLCFHHDEHALRYQADIRAGYELSWEYPYNGKTDWEKEWPSEFTFPYSRLIPQLPEGLRVLSYGPDGRYEQDNLPADGGVVRFRNAENTLLFYNNDTETIVFNDLDASTTASATTRTRTRATYAGSPFTPEAAERTVTEPDVLFGQYRKDLLLEPASSPAPLPVMLKPLVYSYAVIYRFEAGLEYVALARGAISGMAESVYLHTGRTSEKPATVLYECTVEDFGAQAVVRTFGVPGFPRENYTRSGRTYTLNLEVRLKNGIVRTFDFDITGQVEGQPHGGVITVGGIRIEKAEGEKGGGGFDVDVEDWGEFEDIILPL